MSVIERILACEGCGYSGSTFGNADWLTVGMACPNGCGGKVTAFVPEATLRGAVEDARVAGEASMQAAFWRARAIELGASEDEYRKAHPLGGQ